MSDQAALFADVVPGTKPYRPLPAPDENELGRLHRDAHDTERAAARLIEPKTGTLRALALARVFDAGSEGLTHGELAEVTGKNHYSIAPRVTELVDLGWVIDSGQRRKTALGSPAIVWICSERGRGEYPKRGAA